MTDNHIQLRPEDRVVIHNEDGEALLAITVKPYDRGRHDGLILGYRSPHLLHQTAQEWVRPDEGEEV